MWEAEGGIGDTDCGAIGNDECRMTNEGILSALECYQDGAKRLSQLGHYSLFNCHLFGVRVLRIRNVDCGLNRTDWKLSGCGAERVRCLMSASLAGGAAGRYVC